jgi:hypothetical protein
VTQNRDRRKCRRILEVEEKHIRPDLYKGGKPFVCPNDKGNRTVSIPIG